MVKYFTIKTPVGYVKVSACDNFVRRIQFIASHQSTFPQASNGILDEAKKQLKEYFNGTRSVFHLPMKIELAPFYKKTLMEVRKIKYGQKVSYSMVAKIIGSENAVRAVGTANSKNPLPIIIPCHRVVRSDGQLGGYSGGIEKKSILLNLESTFLNTVF